MMLSAVGCIFKSLEDLREAGRWNRSCEVIVRTVNVVSEEKIMRD